MNYQQIIRAKTKKGQRAIISYLDYWYLNRENGKARPTNRICLFCSEQRDLTDEHVLPRWVFAKDPERIFTTTINGLSHKYNRTTIDACATCNNELLSELEKRILSLFERHRQHSNFFDTSERAEIIQWLELLDYKFQVLSLMTKFRAFKGKGSIPFLTDYSLSVLDPNVDYSPAKVLRNLRAALNRIGKKTKTVQDNSLITFKTRNPDMHFFHKNNDFIFLELPMFNLALLHFFSRSFLNELEAKDAAMEIIKANYQVYCN